MPPKKNYQKGLEDFNKILQQDPNNKQALRNRAKVYEELKDFNNSINDYQKLIQLDPQNPEYHYRSGKIKLRVGHYQKAQLDFNKAVQLNPKDFKPYLFLRKYPKKAKKMEIGIIRISKSHHHGSSYFRRGGWNPELFT